MCSIERHFELDARVEELKQALRGVRDSLDCIWVFSAHDYPEQRTCFENALRLAREQVGRENTASAKQEGE